ncbi:MAG: NTP transferase domain-containing protein [Verrucomicrobiaceae bacterium]|nr:NTP transferase domain-containing protein [Verrucomicrobiaceae bacterium]
MITKAFILGAGLGTRLRPLTDVLPKPLVPVFHEPMANYALRHCQAAGIKEFAINTHHIPEAWQQAYPDGSFHGSPLSFFHEPVLLETGGGIRNISAFIGDDPILVYNGDILTDIDIGKLIAHHQASGNIATLALRSSGQNCNVNIEGDQITDMRNLLGDIPGTHQFTGIYCIEPEILKLIPDEQVTSIVPAFIQLIKQHKLGAIVLDQGDWFDIGNPDAYREVHEHLRSGRNDAIHPDASIHPSAQVDAASCIIGPKAVIEAGAKLTDTIVWPAATVSEGSIHEGAIVTSS